MASSISNLVNNFIEGMHKIKYKHGHEDKNVKLMKLNISIGTVFLNTQILKIPINFNRIQMFVM